MLDIYFSSSPAAAALIYLVLGFSSFCALPVIINLLFKHDYRINQRKFISLTATYLSLFSLMLYPSDFWHLSERFEYEFYFSNPFLHRLSLLLNPASADQCLYCEDIFWTGIEIVLWTAAAINLALSFGMTYILGCRLKSLDRSKMLLWLLAVPLVSPIFIIRACFWKDR
jgi:hypothetical protein